MALRRRNSGKSVSRIGGCRVILHPHVITEQCVRPRIALARTSRKGSSIATGIRQDEKVCTRGHVPRRRRRLDRQRQVGQPGAHVDGDPADRPTPHTPRLWHRRARRARARSADDPQRFRPGPGRCRLPRADRIADGSAQCSGGRRGFSGRRALLCRRLRLAHPLGAPELPAVTAALSAVLFVASLRTVAIGRLKKEFRFARLAVAETAHRCRRRPARSCSPWPACSTGRWC